MTPADTSPEVDVIDLTVPLATGDTLHALLISTPSASLRWPTTEPWRPSRRTDCPCKAKA